MIETQSSSLKQILLEQNLITTDQLRAAKDEKKRHPSLLREILVDLNFINSMQLQRVLSQVTGLPYLDLNEITIDPQAFTLLPLATLKHYQALPFDYQVETASFYRHG